MQATYDAAVRDCGIGEALKTYHPAELRFGDESFPVGIRLKGNPCTFLAGGKMQFRIDMDRYVAGQRLRGKERLNLEAANYDPTGLKNGLALEVFRRVGLVAPRANFASLSVNGVYYGVYENLEHIDEEFLEDNYRDPSGNLYWFIWNGHYGALKTNEEVGDVSRWTEMEALVNATPGTVSLAEFTSRIGTYIDVEATLLALATEAVIPQTDGVWAGSANCYVYDDPAGCGGAGCMQYLPWDLDSAFLVPPLDLCPACGSEPGTVDADPITFVTGRGPAAKWRLFTLLVSTDVYRETFVEDLRAALERGYEVEVLEADHAERFALIEPYARLDARVDYDRFVSENERLGAFFAQRADFLERWLEGER